jgi:hypothetical protein
MRRWPKELLLESTGGDVTPHYLFFKAPRQ